MQPTGVRRDAAMGTGAVVTYLLLGTIFAVLTGLLPLTAAAQPAYKPVQAAQAWARATPPQQRVTTGYIVLTSPADDQLLGASSAAAGRVEVHEMTMEGSIMHMRAVPGGVRLPPGKAVGLTPGGYHLMLSELRRPLVVGQTIPVELHFQHAPPLEVQFQVLKLGSTGPEPARAPAYPAPMAGMKDMPR